MHAAPIAARGQQVRLHQMAKVRGQGVVRHAHALGDLARPQAFGPRRHEQAEDGKAGGLRQRPEGVDGGRQVHMSRNID